MAQPSRRRRRAEEVATEPMVRRSPRLTNRLSQLVDSEAHPLHHHQVYSRPSLGGRGKGRRSKSRSVTPNTAVLNESGQTVPVAFESTINISRREGEPHHLYGLDSDEIEIEYEDSDPHDAGSQPTRWNVYDKERIVITQPPFPDEPDGPGFCPSVVQFFTSLLFKIGSFLYLTAVAMLCLDVIVLHRLFNFASVSQRAGSISRFFVLLLVLFALIGFLIGSQLFPAGSNYGPADKVNISEAHLNSLVAGITKSVESKMVTDLDNFEARFKRDLDDHITSLVHSSITRLKFDQKDDLLAEAEKQNKALLQLREDLMNELDDFKDRQLSELRNFMESKFSDMPSRLDELKNSLEPQVNDLREGQNDLLQATKQKFDTFTQKQEGLIMNMSTVQLYLERQNGRISSLEEKLRDVVMEMATFKSNYLDRLNSSQNQPLSENMVVDIFNQELEKATADKESALRLWLDLVFGSKNDLQNVHKRIDELQSMIRSGVPGSGDLSRKDVEDMISLSLRKYSADRIGRFDFALESSGGSVMLNQCSPTYSRTLTSVSLFGMIPLWNYISSPKVIIRPSMYPGDCWAMEGQKGHATVKLRDEVVITGVTLDHIPQELSPNGTLDTTPKEFIVLGLNNVAEEGVQLGTFMYDLDGAPIQEFNIAELTEASSYHFARFEFLSNYGNQNYTCVYRVRVHGHYP